MRAQAGVLKRAVIEEQNKNATLREAFRVKETNLRRVEQEVDSLGFRNKQLEHRVASLQDDLTTINAGNSKKSGKLLNRQSSTHQTTGNTASPPPHESDSIFNEELQKKIVECAQLSSTVADKSSEIQLQYNRISELEDLIHRMNAEHSDAEAKLRSEIARLTTANHEMETKLTEASSIVSSDDTIFVTDCDPITKASANGSTSNGSNVNNCKLEERLAVLEKEVIAWQTQCETLEIAAKMANETNDIKDIDGNLKTIDADIKNAPIEGEEHSGQQLTGREQMLVDHFQKKCEKLLVDKLVAESKLVLFMEEVRFGFTFGFLRNFKSNNDFYGVFVSFP